MSYLTINEMAEILKIPARTIQYLIQKGEGPEAVKIGRTLRVSQTAFEAWIKQLNEGGGQSKWIL